VSLPSASPAVVSERWPELPYAAWRDTMDTLHMELQVIGKLRLALSPFEPQWGNVPLYVTARGLTTSPMSASGVTFEVQVDLLDHQVMLLASSGATRRVALSARPVASFYSEFTAALKSLGISVDISLRPSEVDNPIPFDQDFTHSTYDPVAVTRFFRVLSDIDLILKEHRAYFRGRSSLVQFFWGTFDLALSRFSGRPATPPKNAGIIYRLSADAEQICVGFWPGGSRFPEPAFFGYEYPKPAAIEAEPIRPATARWDADLGEFVLPYHEVRKVTSPRDAILEFWESVYAAGARKSSWDPRLAIARQPV
jgi:hypothetical protein